MGRAFLPRRFLQAIDQGLSLEPDHPRLLCEKAFILVRLSEPQEALRLYQEAENARSWTPPETMAQALRGQGMALLDLNRLEEAKAALHESLEYVPDNDVALHELEYIRQLGLETSSAKTGQKPLGFLRKLLRFRSG